ncbi:MAG: hypothetical protein ACKVY0_02020 [Prosthecobacter sp.]|uniref:hypothetical protein n=1 Tax=Prosthecobacter sp. TaxID=1965333 RepID=UPI0039042BF9
MEITWAQGVFAFCGGVLAPATGILCVWRLRRQDVSPLKGFVLGFGTVFCALIAVSFLARFIFPGYPRVTVPEPIAISFTIPVFASSILAIWLVVRKRSCSTRFPFGGASALLTLYVAGIFAAYHMFSWPYRKALPWSASEVEEHIWTAGFLPDFSYSLRARITEEQFLDYVARFELKSAGKREYYFFERDEAPRWGPSPGAYETYRREDGDWSMEAMYDNGIMWVTANET